MPSTEDNSGMDHFTPVNPRRATASEAPHPSPSVMCVGGMLRVVTAPTELPSSPVHTPAVQPKPAKQLAAAVVGESQEVPPQPQPLLTQKQVRELRRLCRKTANRAEFEDRLIQVRQIASIAAMGAPAVQFSDPHNPTSGSALRAWVDFHREHGADWRDERPLPDNAIDELRRWDRGLKAWARLRFETVPASGSSVRSQFASGATPSRPPGFAPYTSPITPCGEKSRNISTGQVHFASLVSPDTAGDGSVDSSAMAFLANQKSRDSVPARTSGLSSLVNGGRKPMSEVSINRVGDTINITVPTALMSDMQVEDNVNDQSRNISRFDQENVYSSNPKKQVPLHAANTAKSWRNTMTEHTHSDFTLTADKELAFRTAAKSLFSNASKDATVAGNSGIAAPSTYTQRPDMDWAKLRRPALRTISGSSNVNTQPMQKTYK